jgi:hypothetical protein
VTVVGGDGIATNATWKFGDSIRTEQGLTVDRNFGQAGPTEVIVNVETDINTKASKMLLVNVCQTNGGGCSLGTGGVQCCAPLTCKGTTIPSCSP